MDDTQRKTLRGQAHALQAELTIGEGGVHEGTIGELQVSLAAKELIKVRFTTPDRKERKAQIRELAAATESEVVLTIGKVATYYREAPPAAEPAPPDALA